MQKIVYSDYRFVPTSTNRSLHNLNTLLRNILGRVFPSTPHFGEFRYAYRASAVRWNPTPYKSGGWVYEPDPFCSI